MTAPSNRPFADLSGRRSLVTGSSSGIGQAIAEELGRAGSGVILHCARSRDAADEVADTLRGIGVRSELLQADLLEADAAEFVSQALDVWGGIDIWVNNAGVDLLTGPGAELDYPSKLRRLLDVDVTGTVMLSRHVAERMKQQGHGVILNIGWDQADRGMAGDSGELFSVAKNAVMGYTRSLAVSVAPEVRVNCIAPGWIRTAWGDQASDSWQQRVLDETPLKRWGTPQDIARLARFLVSDEAAYLTGQVINANGGAVR